VFPSPAHVNPFPARSPSSTLVIPLRVCRIAADHPTSLHPLCILLANRQTILWQPPAPLRFIQAGGSESERILSEKIYLR
jgi:hypothetical protein